MKLLRGAAQASGYRVVHLVDHEDLGLLHFEETGEAPEGLDFAILRNGVWHEGHCYVSFSNKTFVTYSDAQRHALGPGMLARLSRYTLGPDQLLELAYHYAYDLGYSLVQDCEIVGEDMTITAGEYARVAIHLREGRPPVQVTINLYSNGDIRLIANTEVFLSTPSFDAEGTIG